MRGGPSEVLLGGAGNQVEAIDDQSEQTNNQKMQLILQEL